ncbi:MAG: sigma-70 family RNA polymerase sigma factor [Planctomycetes bacterium]|nr:sigma-70 family RNA polymerase sigma factor [Planctomycetota bacterium]
MSCTASPVPSVVPADLGAPHLPRARAVARRLLGCDHLADDVVQEAHLALTALATPPDEPRAWLVRAVVLRCRQLRRTLARRRRHEHTASQHCALHADCDNPLHVAIAHELGEALQRGVDALPPEQRAAWELFALQAVDYAGVAERLCLPVGTVRSRLHRARAVLRGVLAAHQPG